MDPTSEGLFKIAEALERMGDLTSDIVWGANCNNISELDYKVGRIADALERIATALTDDPDQYEYRKTYIYGAEDAEKSCAVGAIGSVEGLRDIGFEIYEVSDGLFTMRRLIRGPRQRIAAENKRLADEIDHLYNRLEAAHREIAALKGEEFESG